MKSLYIMTAFVLVAGLSSSSFAAPSSAKRKANLQVQMKKTKKFAKKPSKALPQKISKAETLPPAPAYIPSVTSTTVNASKTNLRAVKAEVTPKRWGLLVDSWNEAAAGNLNRASADEDVEQVSTNYMLIRPSYKITDTLSTALGFEFYHTYATHKSPQKAEVTDPYLQLAHTNLGTLDILKTKGYFRYYAPLSIASQDPHSGRYGMFRAQYNVIAPVSKVFTFSYNLEPRYYLQKGLSYEKRPGFSDYVVTEQARVKHWLGISAAAGALEIYHNTGMTSQFYNEDEDPSTGLRATADQKNILYLETGLVYGLTDYFTMGVGIYTESRDLTKKPDVSLYRDDESYYFLDLTLAI